MRGWVGAGVVAVAVVLAFAGEDPAEPAATGSPAPAERVAEPSAVVGTWTETDCPVDPGDTDIAVTCGELAVPVRRDVAGGPTMGLAVAVLHRRADPGLDDAVLYLVGGPGGSALAELEAWTTDPLLDERDIVLLDQRGTGWSTPSLQCPESHEAEDADGQLEAYERCRSRLVDDGVDLEAYSTASIAADVADLPGRPGLRHVGPVGQLLRDAHRPRRPARPFRGCAQRRAGGRLSDGCRRLRRHGPRRHQRPGRLFVLCEVDRPAATPIPTLQEPLQRPSTGSTPSR